ncbi:hypothetical protein EW145_g5137 [Phellinidium pouzarii]|uniref:Protein LTV1 n=1 Tax=Phellinidium pouzarii TaxID=167371 RepID=A0A4S4L129_9AGAM|nr:hypothetical protein EW145_g5137 [Phellinidium pouzarii]
MPSKSVFKQPGTRHFQLVHRSQRDPLIHDSDASQHVLKPIVRGKTRAELERMLAPEELAHDLERANIGEASQFGVYYDDTEYDYMQHLRQVGLREDGIDGVLIEAPVSSSSKRIGGLKGKRKARGEVEGDLLCDLPHEALPSVLERSREEVYNSQAAVPPALVGLQPDMDPHLRQTLEALEDDAFVDDNLDDDFFSSLVGEGDRGSCDDEESGFEFAEDGLEEDEGSGADAETGAEQRSKSHGLDKEQKEVEDNSWQARFAKFKKDHEAHSESDIASDIQSEGGDTVGQLPTASVIGGKKRRKGASDASGYSMSSSSMFRNEGLTLLDEHFNQVEKEYASNDEEEELSDDSDEASELITSREDFNTIMNDFLDNYEILGGKMRPVLAGETVADKLGTIRQSLKEIGYDAHEQLLQEDDEENDDMFETYVEEKAARWDCETVLSTYSKLENHPRLIRARETKIMPKIHLDPKTGLPSVKSVNDEEHLVTNGLASVESEAVRLIRIPVARPKKETKEEKHARKQSVKDERQARRVEKKATKDHFSTEKKQQLQVLANTSKKGIRKL